MLENIREIITIPLCFLIIICGVYLSFKSKFIQRQLPSSLKCIKTNDSKGGMSGFATLCITLSATVGTGNIIGVATAITLGGAGSIFWMVVAGIISMATKYAEGVLSVVYRTTDENGNRSGGPYIYIDRALSKHHSKPAVLYAIFGAAAGLLGIGTFTQVNGFSDATCLIFDKGATFAFGLSPTKIISGVVIALLSAFVIIGGAKRIVEISEIVVPPMSVIYTLLTVVIILINIDKLPNALYTIITSAFNTSSVSGTVCGIAIKKVIEIGFIRGVFSNEAGLGSGAIAAGNSDCDDPQSQGLIMMLATFIDTVIICLLTGLVILVTDAYDLAIDGTLKGLYITAYAFSNGIKFIPQISIIILSVCVCFFAFTSIIGWNYYYISCVKYLTCNRDIIKVMNFLYILALFIGVFFSVDLVYLLADIFNAFMAIPNLFSLMFFSNTVKANTREYV